MKLTTGLASKPDCLDSILTNLDPFSLSQQQIAIGSNQHNLFLSKVTKLRFHQIPGQFGYKGTELQINPSLAYLAPERGDPYCVSPWGENQAKLGVFLVPNLVQGSLLGLTLVLYKTVKSVLVAWFMAVWQRLNMVDPLKLYVASPQGARSFV